MPAIAPILADMALNAITVAGAVLSARVVLFCVHFYRGVIKGWDSK